MSQSDYIHTNGKFSSMEGLIYYSLSRETATEVGVGGLNQCHWPNEQPFLNNYNVQLFVHILGSLHGIEISHGSKCNRI